MFDPYAESLVSSTGEPPTQSSAVLSVQEPDSGYEASPSSIAESHQRFFGDGSRQSRIDQSNLSVNSDDEYNVEYDEQILFSNSESEEYDTCPECSSSAVSCSCFRTDSSNTNCTAMSNCDNNSRCSSSEQFTRPSSQPITIPNLPIRITSDVSRGIVMGSPVNIGLLTRSQPTNFNPVHRLDLIPDRLPLSWPSNTSSTLRNFNNFALNSAQRSNVRDIPRSNVRPRHSENSSYGTSDDDCEEGPEDVFHMPDEASSYPTMMTLSSAPLPDVIPESTDSGRRSRSMSINLPPDRAQILYNIGRNLRRMSDEFIQTRQLSMARRGRSRTESECADHLHRNGLS